MIMKIFSAIVLIGILSSSTVNASVSSDETWYPVLDPDPLDLWNSADVIIDGNILEVWTETTNGTNTLQYNIEVNKYFKGDSKSNIVFAKGIIGVSEFEVGENALFYLKMEDNFPYVIQPYSVKTYENCEAREFIEIIPVLPNEKFPISSPAIDENWIDPCVANYFTYDPNFWFTIVHPSPLQQIKAGLDPQKVQCKDEHKELIFKINNMPACVFHDSVSKLIERGWALS